MHSFKTAVPIVQFTNSDMYGHSPPPPPFYLRGDESLRNCTPYMDLVELQQATAEFHQQNHVDFSTMNVGSGCSELKHNNVAVSDNLQFAAGLDKNMGCGVMGISVAGGEDEGLFFMRKGTSGSALGKGNLENWGDTGMADYSQHTESLTDVETDDKCQYHGAQGNDSFIEQSAVQIGEQKTIRRLAQNREAARKSRLRKKAYVQQLENSRIRLSQLEQELKRVHQQGVVAGSGYSGDHSQSAGGNGNLNFEMDYANWLDEHQRLINDLRTAVNTHLSDNNLRLLVDGVMSHYDQVFKLKSVATKSDVFYVLSGMWKTPAERCFMWLGGFRSSEILKVLGSHLDPLTDQQLVGICNLQQSAQQAEDALSQGMEALQQSLVDTLSSNSLGPNGSGNIADYMGQMAIAMSKLTTLENFLHQADLLRQQTLQQLYRILTTRQAARAFLVLSDYMSRLRALSSLWEARPKD